MTQSCSRGHRRVLGSSDRELILIVGMESHVVGLVAGRGVGNAGNDPGGRSEAGLQSEGIQTSSIAPLSIPNFETARPTVRTLPVSSDRIPSTLAKIESFAGR
jgi:hypothetical protein